MEGIAPRRFGWLIVVAAVLAMILVAICQDPFSYTSRMHGLMRILDARSLSERQKVNAAEVVVRNRVNVQPGERVLLIVQNEGERRLVGKYLEAQVRDLKAIPTVIYVEDSEMKAEPPQRVVDEMLRSDVILAILSFDNIQAFAHTRARNVATDDRGARVGLVPALWRTLP